MQGPLCPHCGYFPANPRYHGYCSHDCEEHAEECTAADSRKAESA